MNTMTPLAEAVQNTVVEKDGRVTLACPAAFHIAETLAVDLSAIGAYCNEKGIKIVKCQLGCFP